MASNRIKGITIEIGGDTTKLDKALSGTDKQLKQTTTSLKDIERLLKLDPGNVELLVQKQRLLTDAVEGTAARLHTLEDAAQQAGKALASGEISQGQFDALNREIVETQINLEKLTGEADDFDIDTAVREAENRLNDLGSAADDAGSSLDDLSGSSGGLSGGLSGLGGIADGVAIEIGQKLVEAAMAAVEWLWSLDEATEEYREAMGKLNTAFETAGYGPEAAKEAYEGFYRILGDTDTATEAAQLLAQLADSEEDLSKWTEIAAGVYGTFGDSLPIEGLIEAANETAKTGKVTGVLADALNWVGMNEDEFNERLATMSTEGERARFIMGGLSSAYRDAADSLYENNQVLIESREAQMQMDEATANLGGTVAEFKNKLFDLFGPAAIEAINSMGGAIEGLAPVFEKLEEEEIGEKLVSVVKLVSELFGELGKAFSPLVAHGIEFIAQALDVLIFALEGIVKVLDWVNDRISDAINLFGDLFGVSKKTSNISVSDSGAKARSVIAEPYSLSADIAGNLPYLAQGAVTRPNSPFLAVVGDNPNEPEIVSPLSTIEQAVRNVMGTFGQASNIRVTVNFTGSGAQLVRMLQPQIVAETNRLGPQFVN